jgi:hypothetical protein
MGVGYRTYLTSTQADKWREIYRAPLSPSLVVNASLRAPVVKSRRMGASRWCVAATTPWSTNRDTGYRGGGGGGGGDNTRVVW